jgi:O-antigen/teichoic acid export membrane protein
MPGRNFKSFGYDRMLRLASEGSWVVFGQILSILGSLLVIRVLTEYMSPPAFGQLALAMTIPIMINQTIFGPIGNGIARFYMPSKESGDFDEYLISIKTISISASLLVGMLGVVLIIYLFLIREIQWVALAGAALIFSVLSGWSSIISGMQACERRRSLVAAYQAAEPFLKGIFAVVFMWTVSFNATMAISGYVAGLALLIFIQILIFRMMAKRREAKTTQNSEKFWREKILKYSWPMGVWGIFTAIQLASDRWALETYSNPGDVGIYSVLYQLGFVPITLISGMAVQIILPIMYARAGDAVDEIRVGNAKYLGRILTKLTLFLTCISFVTAYFMHPIIFNILAGEKYRSMSYLLPWMVLAGGLFAGGQSLSSNLLIQNKTQKMLTIKICTAILGIAMNLIGAYYWGVEGVVGSACIFSILYLCWIYLLTSGKEN